ncbi:4-hydroxyproline epimerase [Rhodospirillum rubrum]|uniref:Proline racemase n=1 Tax=Rhodospirillum rubrum (strain ATCC 11170 / ATH 1.1.1 / DSM 467 / LMG 4362 / NCIMB 8255 / S1) TaxID=269796 RepID=Q2RSN0_RHORT|nr:4-hydroxyproline epimerase [Rhodospirillum rubrum]ABC22865.1 Proline racemase [Rhodospirillum rubrum ATCC 11170]AEO48588.1 hydroxyproline-2-epimerase [Rhodospirillum rubrum F11]MBK5954472.1 hydroxyproline-2-epimerase [Rhodospirillum rubrum]QXG78853.1 4-hydroxyproline epimerase [Rhodospirillum rubrum]HAP99389.1 4-hydroxyproline epimerase [Rhodospirillum rubrum]
MARHTFSCIDAHTCGNPVRLVSGGAPLLTGATMMERRAHFLREYDWIRTGLMFEPRGHDAMSGSILYPPTRADCDIAILFIETSGCLPMCGHGTIGTVTVALEHGLVRPREPGLLRLDTPAGVVEARYTQQGDKITSVRLRNVPAYLHGTGYQVEVPGLGPLTFDIAYGGNFYAIIEPQPGYADLDALSVMDIQSFSPKIRALVNERYEIIHKADPRLRGLSHVMWTGKPRDALAQGRNAVFYGERGVDRSPCGTGTSARMAQLAARGALAPGDAFVHESIIGSLFHGRVEEATTVGDSPAIIPSVEGSAWVTGLNTLFLYDEEPYSQGFLLP